MEEESSTPEVKKGSKFHPTGKYFLIGIVIIAQALLAYLIVDKNFEVIYRTTNDLLSGSETGTYQIGELIVNPAGTQGQRYLVVELYLELQHSDHIELVGNNIQKIRHKMIDALSTRTVDELARFEEREYLREELSGIVNEAIGIRSVRNLYYTRYVMQ